MLCEKCQAKVASITLQQFQEGKLTELHLCPECSLKLQMPISLQNMFKGFLDQMNIIAENPSSFVMKQGQSPIKKSQQQTVVKCPVCGLTINEFKKSGKLGCETCYTSYPKAIESLLKNIHGSTRHVGKFPKRVGLEIKQKRMTQDLKAELNKAVQEENYEEAARLRDEIRSLEASQ